MKILFVGDIYGRPGRTILERELNNIKEKYQIDFVIVNAENSSHGRGLTKKNYDELVMIGINAMTMGNHTFDQKETLEYIDDAHFMVRPANYSDKLPGLGTKVFHFKNKKIRVSNVMGHVGMNFPLNNMFDCMDSIIENDDSDIHIVDIHAEATSEKIGMAYYLDGKVSAVIGTHTHVQTADERILEKGTACITDVGMTGPINGVIGATKESSLYRLKTGLPGKFEVADFPVVFSAVVISFDSQNNKCTNIERIYEIYE